MDGNVLFSWNGDPTQNYYVKIDRDRTNSGWKRQNVTQYTVEDALLYDSIKITVNVLDGSAYNIMTYNGIIFIFKYCYIYRITFTDNDLS